MSINDLFSWLDELFPEIPNRKTRDSEPEKEDEYEWSMDEGWTRKDSDHGYGECRWDSDFD